MSTDSPASPNNAHGGRIDDIEILRAVAIIFVLVEHIPLNLVPWNEPAHAYIREHLGFWTGVDLFFAVSGYVIARQLLPRLEAASTSSQIWAETFAFWIRRAWRLLPSAWLWLTLTFVASLTLNETDVFRSLQGNISGTLASVFYYANFHFLRALELGPDFHTAQIHYWSLSLEEQFYILLPLAVMLLGRRLWMFMVLAIVVQAFIVRYGPNADLLLMPFRTDALLMGALLAQAQYKLPRYARLQPVLLERRPLLRWIIVVAALTALPIIATPVPEIYTLTLIALLSAFLVWLASYNRNYFMPAGPLKDLALWFGSRSYALYLIHFPLFRGIPELWHRIFPDTTIYTQSLAPYYYVSAAVLLVVFAELNYRFVEMPLRRHGARMAARLLERSNTAKGVLGQQPSAAKAD